MIKNGAMTNIFLFISGIMWNFCSLFGDITLIEGQDLCLQSLVLSRVNVCVTSFPVKLKQNSNSFKAVGLSKRLI